MQELINKIKLYRTQYWETGSSDIPDEEYEALLGLLEQQDPDNPLLNEIEAPNLKNDDKIHHPIPMLSLQKVFSWDEVYDWMKKVARNTEELFLFEPKFDGISGKFYIDAQVLATRGDGEFGENISDKLSKIKLTSPNAESFNKLTSDTIGEILISHKSFEEINTDKKYKTNRNLVCGVTNSKELLDIELEFIDYNSFSSAIFLKDANGNILDEILKFNSTYPLDGVVIKLADKDYYESLGVTGHHPRGAIAFKPKTAVVKTKLLNVILSPGKNKFTPVAIIDPVIINGVTITKASLHNAKELIDNDIHINDYVYITRSGDVIPHILHIEKNGAERKRIIFNECEFCGSEIKYIEPELYCSNDECPGNLKIQLLNSAKILGIENLGLPTIEKIIDTFGDINTIYDILVLEYEDFLELDGFKETSSRKLYDNIQSILRNCKDYKVIAALNIPGVGIGLLKQVLSRVNIEELLKLDIATLATFENFSDIRAASLVNGLIKHKSLLNNLFKTINIVETKVKIETQSVAKKTICFSGTFDKPKQYYYNIAQQKGLEIVDSVTSKLDYLVTAGDLTSKVTKAKKNGYTKILEIGEFLSL